MWWSYLIYESAYLPTCIPTYIPTYLLVMTAPSRKKTSSGVDCQSALKRDALPWRPKEPRPWFEPHGHPTGGKFYEGIGRDEDDEIGILLPNGMAPFTSFACNSSLY